MSHGRAPSQGVVSTTRWRPTSPMNATSPKPSQRSRTFPGRWRRPVSVAGRFGDPAGGVDGMQAGRPHHGHDHHLTTRSEGRDRIAGVRPLRSARGDARPRSCPTPVRRRASHAPTIASRSPGTGDRQVWPCPDRAKRSCGSEASSRPRHAHSPQTKSRLQPNGRVLATAHGRPASTSSSAFARSWLVTRSSIRESSKRPS